MDTAAIAQHLAPFLPRAGSRADLLAGVQAHLELLLRWNRRLNLTAIRDEQNIVTRHFGEALFAAAHLFSQPDAVHTQRLPASVIDVGSGAGFPGIPVKLYAPDLRLTLVEAHGKKATFLREVIRTLRLTDAAVVSARVERLSDQEPTLAADVVTLRAVEEFEGILPAAARLVRPGGQLALLIGTKQAARAAELLPSWTWAASLPIPHSAARVLLCGSRRN